MPYLSDENLDPFDIYDQEDYNPNDFSMEEVEKVLSHCLTTGLLRFSESFRCLNCDSSKFLLKVPRASIPFECFDDGTLEIEDQFIAIEALDEELFTVECQECGHRETKAASELGFIQT